MTGGEAFPRGLAGWGLWAAAFVAVGCAAGLGVLPGPALVAGFAGLMLGLAAALSGSRRWWWLLLALLAPLAGWRAAGVVAEPDPLAGLDGQNLAVRGAWDGRVFTAHGARVYASFPPGGCGAPRAWPAPVALGRRGPPAFRPAAGEYALNGSLFALSTPGNPGVFDSVASARRRGVRHRLSVTTCKLLAAPGGVGGVLASTRAWLNAGAGAGLNAPSAAFMRALAFGDTSDFGSLDDALPGDAFGLGGLSWRDAFTRSGLAHILALSGQQVTLLVGCVAWLLRSRRFNRWRFVLLGAFVLAFVVLVGPSPSVNRAAVMALLALLGLSFGRALGPWSVIGVTAAGALLAGPLWLPDAGFLLSYLAVAGLIAFTPFLVRLGESLFGAPKILAAGAPSTSRRRQLWGWRDLARFVWLVGAASVAAQAFTLPLVASNFGRVPWGTLPANLIAVPAAGFLVPLGFVAGLLGPTLGQAVNLLVAPLAGVVLWSATTFAAWPGVSWGAVSLGGWLAYAAATGAVLLAVQGAWRWRPAMLVVLAALLATSAGRLGFGERAVIHFLDVGQGDGTLVRLGRDDVLVDGGGSPAGGFDSAGRVLEPALRALGVRALRAVVFTHADADHVENALAILRDYPVGGLVISHHAARPEVLGLLLAEAEARGIPVLEAARGQSLILDGGALRFLAPDAVGVRDASRDENARSLAVVVEAHGRRVLLVGDLPGAAEAALWPGRLDALLCGHHGSRSSTGAALLAATRPALAVISSGENRYGHPNAETLARLVAAGVSIHRTDRDGMLSYDLTTGLATPYRLTPAWGRPGAPGSL